MEVPAKIQSPLITGIDPVTGKERSERNNRRISDFISDEMSISSASLSSSTSSSLSSLSTPNSPKIVVTESGTDVSDNLVRLTRINTNSREKLIYAPYGEDDLLNENKMPFTDVNFCFHCDKEGIPQITSHRRKNTVIEAPTQSTWTPTSSTTSKQRRPRSTSSIGTVGRDHLRMSIEKTGSRMVKEKDLIVAVYRQIFLCSGCQEKTMKEKAINPDYVVQISPRARTYF